MTVVVIGAGLGGLAAAAILARAGQRVLVLERHTEPGGFAVTFTREGFRFDASLHHLDAVGPGQANRPLLDELGISGRLDLYLDPILRRDRVAGLDLMLPQEPLALTEVLGAAFPGESAGLRSLFQLAATSHAETYSGALPSQRGTAAALLETLFRSSALRHIVGGITSYVGRTPETCPVATFLLLFHAYHAEGGWRLRGGSSALTAALVEVIRAAGGEVRTGAEATAVRLARGRIAGVTLADGEGVEATDVVAALPLPRLAALLPAGGPLDAWRSRLAALPLSTSLWRLSLGLSGDHTAGQAYETRLADDAGTVSLTIPSVGDADWAPAGATSLSASMPAPLSSAPSARAAATERLLSAVRTLLPDVDRHIVVRSLAHPGTWERYTGAPGGATMGAGPGARAVSARSPLPGLVLAGAWVPPGPGQTAVMHSGRRAARLILGER